VLLRLREMITQATGLEYVDQEGDLLIRLRRPLDGSVGWDVLIRLSPRPLSVRPWRVCNLPGALNATVAQAMVYLSRPHPDDFVLNLCCGSATLLIERLASGPARIAVGCDVDPAALDCARANISASGHSAAQSYDWDAGALPVPDCSVDTILVDLPFGHTIGTHTANVELYPRLLHQAARVLIRGGLIVAITEDIRLWERLIGESADDWSVVALQRVKIPFASGYLHPQISVLRRN
jgi:23S rRNA G2445 N2-methylase RlmL